MAHPPRAAGPRMKSIKRVFLALPLAPYFGREVQAYVDGLEPRSRGLKWSAPRQVHVTLHFFGPVSEEDYAKIKRIGDACAQETAPLSLALEGLGFFPDERRPRVVWLGMKGDTAALGALQAALEASLKSEGFACEDRKFTPHATLARVKNISEFRLEPRTDFPATAPARIDHMVLYESLPSPQGPFYEAVEKVPFAV